MADYESIRQRHAARLFELVPARFEAMTWTGERRREEQVAQLRALIARAQATSPWHRRRLAGIAAERMTLADLATVPPMTKGDLMQNFDEIVADARLARERVEAHLDGLTADAYLFDEYHVCASGGSSGQRGVFVYDFDAWAIVFASYLRFSARLMQDALPGETPVIATVAADKASHMTSALSQTFAPPGQQVHRLPATWPIARIVAGLNEIQPGLLFGYASMLRQLTAEAAAGRLRIAPRLIGSTSEPLLPEIRAAVSATWRVPVYNTFGATEGLMGGSCSAGSGLHLSDDLFLIEPVDERGAAVAPGERAAKVYLTNLFNHVQPLIRYELTDEMTVRDEPCSCGVTLLRIDDLQGRLDDAFVYPAGLTVHPLTFRSILGRERAVVEYQVRQTPAGAEILLRAEGPVDTTRIGAALDAALRSLGLAEPSVTVVVVDALERQLTGKLRRFLPLSPAA